MDDIIKKYFENPKKIEAVKPIEEYILLITFDNGEVKKYDMKNELTGVFPIFIQMVTDSSFFLTGLFDEVETGFF